MAVSLLMSADDRGFVNVADLSLQSLVIDISMPSSRTAVVHRSNRE